MKNAKMIFSQVRKELKRHAPFTVLGALAGIILIIAFSGIPKDISFKIFYVLHPIHVVFSAVVTASLYQSHTYEKQERGVSFFWLMVVGYAGAIGISTLSDSLVPYLGETLLNLPEKETHLGFIEKWWLINPLAVAGTIVAYFKPQTRLPHAGHVLLSTSASTFHIIMALGKDIPLVQYLVIVVFLFIAVWLPCCLSDLIFPVILAETEKRD